LIATYQIEQMRVALEAARIHRSEAGATPRRYLIVTSADSLFKKR